MKIDFSDYEDLINPAFIDFFYNRDRIRISYGGAGSGKSFEYFEEVIYRILAEPGHNYLICRKVANTNKTSTYALTKQIINKLGLSSVFKENKTDMTFTVKSTGYMIAFKGLDDIEKIKSITFPNGELTDIGIEEASEISQKDFDQLNVRLRGKAKQPFQITMLLNPISDQHWIKREFFDLRSYQKRTKVCILHTTYLDNDFIDDDYRDILEGYKDIDLEFYKVYCLGEWGSFGNIIFTNWVGMACPYKEEDFDAVYAGMDFGFNHPNIIKKIGLKDGNLYSFSELCLFGKTNKEFIEANAEFEILKKGEPCTADSAEPSKIKEWQQAGYGVIGAKKGKDSVSRGIDYIKSFKWFIDPIKCPRTLQEAQVYHWKEDKMGEVIIPEKPVDLLDDCLKSMMYALENLSRAHGKPSVLSGTKSKHKKEVLEVKKAERKKNREVVKAQRKERREKERNLKKKVLSGR